MYIPVIKGKQCINRKKVRLTACAYPAAPHYRIKRKKFLFLYKICENPSSVYIFKSTTINITTVLCLRQCGLSKLSHTRKENHFHRLG